MRRLIGFITLLLCFTVNAEQKVTVFAAASLTNAMQDIGQLYQTQNPDTEVIFSFASSSTLARQIEQGAPAEIFISADQKWMDYLLERDLVSAKELLVKNSLVLIAPIQSTITNVTIDKNTDWTTLLAKGERMAVGDPAHVPAGVYAKESLSNLGIYDKLEPQFAPANNVRAALMLVELDEAKLGIVYSTDAKVSNKVKIVGEFPADSFSPVEYPIALITSDKTAKAFYDFLKTAPAIAILEKYGFVTQ